MTMRSDCHGLDPDTEPKTDFNPDQTLLRAFSERTTTMLKVTYSGFHFRSEGMSWLKISTPAIVPVQPSQYFMPYWNRLPRLRAASTAKRHLLWLGVARCAVEGVPIPKRRGCCKRMMCEHHVQASPGLARMQHTRDRCAST